MGRIVYPEIDLKNIKNIFIDIDDTLYQYEPCHNYALEYCADLAVNKYHLNVTVEEFKQIYRQYRSNVTKRLHPQGVCRSRLIAFIELFADLNVSDSYNLAVQFDIIYWEKLISRIKIEQDAKEFLERAYKNEIIVAAVTDMTTAEQIKKINKMDISKYIKYIISSEMAGVEKPDKRIFQYAINMTKASIDTTIMIGDSVEKDGKGAEAVGIKFYRVIKND